jgi:hypothetical protein
MGQLCSPSRQTAKEKAKKKKKGVSQLAQLGRPTAQPRAPCVVYYLPLMLGRWANLIGGARQEHADRYRSRLLLANDA